VTVSEAPARISARPSVERWNRPLTAGIIALLIGSAFVALRLQSYDWNPTGFVHAGDRFVDARRAPPTLIVRKNAVGFDGTGFYRLGLNPATRERYERGIELDIPAFRHQRILYAVLVWAASGGGRAQAVGWALIAVNLAAFAGLGFLGATLASHFGRKPLWGLLFPAYPGFAVSLGLDTAEIVAAFFVVLTILLVVQHRYVPAAMTLTAAMFTRETTLLLAIGVGLAAVTARYRTRRDEAPSPLYIAAIPTAAYAVWEVFLRWWWGAWPLAGGSAVDLEAPLSGLVMAARDWPRTDGTQAAYHFLLVAAIGAFIATVFVAVRRSHVPAFAVFAFAAGALLALLYSRAIWLHHWGFLRAFTEIYVMGAFIILMTRVGLRRVLVASSALWVSIAINLVLHP
jgi:hypothetical protein